MFTYFPLLYSLFRTETNSFCDRCLQNQWKSFQGFLFVYQKNFFILSLRPPLPQNIQWPSIWDVEDCIQQPLDSSSTTNFNLDFSSKHSFTTLLRVLTSHLFSHLHFASQKKKNLCSSNLTFQIWFKSYGVHMKSHAIKSCNVQQMKHHSMNSLTFDLKVPKWDAYGYFLKPHRDNVLNITVFLLSDS